MIDNERELIHIIRNSKDPEKALECAIALLHSFLAERAKSSVTENN